MVGNPQSCIVMPVHDHLFVGNQVLGSKERPEITAEAVFTRGHHHIGSRYSQFRIFWLSPCCWRWYSLPGSFKQHETGDETGSNITVEVLVVAIAQRHVGQNIDKIVVHLVHDQGPGVCCPCRVHPVPRRRPPGHNREHPRRHSPGVNTHSL